MPPSPFVSTRGTGFLLNGEPFPVSGVNCYFLAYCSDESRRAAMTIAKQMGATVIRSWAFLDALDYTAGQVAFQYFQDGAIQLNEGPNGLQRLDALIKAAEDLNLKLILPLVNHWPDLGGMPAYISWLAPGQPVTEFYRVPTLRSAYQSWVHQILTRRNTLTGRLYSDEPAIIAWELTNEARCPTHGGRELLLNWVTEMSAFVKQLDSNHLLALGDEGFFYKKGFGHLYDGSYGVDWEANLTVSDIDFGTFHLYPETWGHHKHLAFGNRWITHHAEVANRLGKPAILEEYGLKNPAHRNEIYTRWTQTVKDAGLSGSLVWMLGLNAGDAAGYVDDFILYDASDIPG